MGNGSLVATGISVTVLLLTVTYVNVYMVYRFRRKQYEYYKEKQRWARYIMEERDRLMEEVSVDVHDNIGQLTHMLRMSYHRMFKDIDEGLRRSLRQDVAGLIDRIAYHARNIKQTLDRSTMGSRGLGEALRQDARLIELAGITACRVAIEGDKDMAMDSERKLMAYRIAQEALHNALEHADAKNIGIRLHYKAKLFTMVIEDDGKGFVWSKAKENGGIGITNMEQRAARLGGSLTINTVQGKGTTVILSMLHRAMEHNG